MVEALATALGATAVVRKQRTLLWVGQTRVHLDEVEGLGSFLELEVVLEADQSVARGTAIAHDLMARLGVDEDDLVPVAYVDLLQG
jgi:predicted adenylyl cyclase CyaB